MTEPYLQGDFNNTCGIFSILNAYKIIYEANEDSTYFLYEEIVRYFIKKRMWADISLDGMNFKQMNMVMRDVGSKYLDYKVSWMSFPTPTLTIFWNSMKSHLRDNKGCVILGISNREEHWTVAEKSTPRGIRLCDSNGWKYLRKHMCTMYKTEWNRYYLTPAQNFFIFGKGE